MKSAILYKPDCKSKPLAAHSHRAIALLAFLVTTSLFLTGCGGKSAPGPRLGSLPPNSIVWLSRAEGDSDSPRRIYAVDPHFAGGTAEVRQLFELPPSILFPVAFAPDRPQKVFFRVPSGASFETNSLYSNSSFSLSQATKLAEFPSSGGGSAIIDNISVDPTGTRLLLSVFFRPPVDGSEYNIYTMPATGGPLALIATDVNPEPCFSPDGREVIYSKRTGVAASQLFRRSVSGGPEIQLTFEDDLGANSPAISRDGFRIAYINQVGRNIHLRVRSVDGLTSTLRTWTDDFYPTGLVWSAEGTHIGFQADGGIYTIKSDGTDLRRIANGEGDIHSLQWTDSRGR
jgi:hypothetical protein